MKKLKVKFWRIENVVLMKVLEQDEALRHVADFWKDKETGFTITSSVSPCFIPDLKTIYVRGADNSRDNDIFVIVYDNCFKAIEGLNNIMRTIDNFNMSLTTSAKDDVCNDVEVYVVGDLYGLYH
jgi:hypothetical protein